MKLMNNDEAEKLKLNNKKLIIKKKTPEEKEKN